MADSVRPNLGYIDLRDMIGRIDDMGELLRLDGVDWNLEIGALQEILAADGGEAGAPALMFENIPGSPASFRALSGVLGSTGRTAMALGFDQSLAPIGLVQAYR
ncbi:MAG: UbiD family decarboxylase, partial [Rhodospirillales bacterium]|nr:UbiD family decarboxylase [Rhodospirillales bacterium]